MMEDANKSIQKYPLYSQKRPLEESKIDNLLELWVIDTKRGINLKSLMGQ